MFKGWGGGKPKQAQEHPRRGWKPGDEPQYIEKDGAKYVHDEGRDYRIMEEADFRKFRSFADDAEGWTLRVEKNGVFVWDRPTQDKAKSAVNIVKLFAEFKGVPPERMYDVLHDADYRAEWDQSMVEGYNIVHLDANNDVGYYHLKLPTGVANRDFCNQRSWRNVDGSEFIIMNHSEPHARCPPTKAVRGESIISGYLIRPHGDGCSITWVSQSDPKGWIPTMVLNAILTGQAPNMVEKLRSAAAGYPEWKAKHNPDEHDWRTDPEPWTSPVEQQTIRWFAEKTNTSVEEILGTAPSAKAAEKETEKAEEKETEKAEEKETEKAEEKEKEATA